MKNRDMPAAPLDVKQAEYLHKHIEEDWLSPIGLGLSKREMIAMHLHAALLTATDNDGNWTGVDADAAECAVNEADKLLAALERFK